MMCRLLWVCSLVVAAVVHTSAQDPIKTLPDAYKIQFENDHVRVVRVHYAAGAKLPDHTHPPGTTVYVYLNDSDGVVFRHSGNSNRAVTRPPVTTGSVRVSTGREEHHTAENPAATPSDFLRIVLKTDSAGERTMYRLRPNEASFDNKQLRITRLRVEPGKPTWIETPPNQPALIVQLPTGDTRWYAAGQKLALTVTDTAQDLLRIDLLTPPRM